MKQTITQSQFVDAFHACNRADNFSYEGLNALYTWLEELHEDCGTEYELDVIGLCCEFTEYKDLEEYNQDYSEVSSIEDLHGNTTVIIIDDSFIIADY